MLFDLRGGKMAFLRPHKSKKGKKSTEGVQKGTQKFSDIFIFASKSSKNSINSVFTSNVFA